jgi:ferrochelatase
MESMGLRLYWGNRNWSPLLADTLAQMRDDGVTRALAFVTSAYGGYSSCRQYLDDMVAAREVVGAGAPALDKLRLYYNHPGWVGPWAASVAGAQDQAQRALGGAGPVEVLFSAHSIPVAMAETSPYVEHVTETARLAAEVAGVETWRLVWQSRSGSPRTPWLGPDICEVISASEAAAVVVAPVGFVCDNMEIVHDLDVEAAGTAAAKGIPFFRAPTVSSTPEFISMVVDLVRERLTGTFRPEALGSHGPWPDECPLGHCRL